MYTFIMIVHVFVCFVLIAVILLQAGRGGGLSDMAGGGGQQQSILGTQTNTFMTRATEVCAIVFMVTSISLGVISSSRSKSLIEKTRLSRAVQGAVAGATSKPTPSAAPTTPAEPAKALEAAVVSEAAPVVQAAESAVAEVQSQAAAAPTTNSSAS